nr:MAG TPA: hypothetical protein [Caudoviricetes sp.]
MAAKAMQVSQEPESSAAALGTPAVNISFA